VSCHQQSERDTYDQQPEAGSRDVDEWCCHLSGW
jgi:hypothetical protein